MTESQSFVNTRTTQGVEILLGELALLRWLTLASFDHTGERLAHFGRIATLSWHPGIRGCSRHGQWRALEVQREMEVVVTNKKEGQGLTLPLMLPPWALNTTPRGVIESGRRRLNMRLLHGKLRKVIVLVSFFLAG